MKSCTILAFMLAGILLPSVLLAKTIDYTAPCGTSGQVHVIGTWTPMSGTVHLQLEMVNCGTEETSYSGTGTMDGTAILSLKTGSLALNLYLSTETTITNTAVDTVGTSESTWNGKFKLLTKTFTGDVIGTSSRNGTILVSPEELLGAGLQAIAEGD